MTIVADKTVVTESLYLLFLAAGKADVSALACHAADEAWQRTGVEAKSHVEKFVQAGQLAVLHLAPLPPAAREPVRVLLEVRNRVRDFADMKKRQNLLQEVSR